MNQAAKVESIRPAVRCATCNEKVFDGLVVKSRIVRVLPRGAEAMCKRCRGWVAVPLTYRG